MPVDLVTLAHPRSPISEAYRSLRTNLEFTNLDHPIRTLVVTSAGPDEGKSTTLANLAVTTAQAGKSVILVDCDLRRPHQHELFGLSNNVGLTTLVRDETNNASTVLQATAVPGLQVIPSGPLPPNPAELLGSRRMREVIEVLAGLADLVMFDAPPVIAVTDAALLASRLDGVLLVVNAGGTKRDEAQRAKALLDKVNARVVGAVLNNVPLDARMNSYYGTNQ